MSGHQKVFDESISGLPDLTVEADPLKMMGEKIPKEDDELIINDDTPQERFMKPSEIFVMRKKKKQEEENKKIEMERKIVEMKIDEEKNEENIGIKVENDTTNIDLEIKEQELTKKTRGKRGKDKKERKKRVMTDERKAQLAAARKKSLEVRRAKAAAKKAKNTPIESKTTSKPIPIPRPIPPVENHLKSQMSFDYFCGLMDKYEERKRKKVSISQEPHPNKKIPYHQKPRPPVQRVQRAPAQSTRRNRNVARENIRTTPQLESFSAYSILKNQKKNIHSSGWGY